MSNFLYKQYVDLVQENDPSLHKSTSRMKIYNHKI